MIWIVLLCLWLLGCFFFSGKQGRSYAWRTFLWVDQGINVLILNGDPDETVSSRLQKMRANGNVVGKVGCKILDTLDPNHCNKTVECDEGEECK